ncbi:polysaccharide biosynthesis/export family protein [Sphingomonas sp.]|uniref:polysaccharide biosynthesis/export family protein n=1 Tax=Sphingomonas sp. TaxID=28214 RepID=UPI0025D60FC9|nr:polysaccharide biosynthesis/export family protein [Sphingomonas sp.]MBV9526783.1 polysaccharide export protein [Sphingomonas sp.]
MLRSLLAVFLMLFVAACAEGPTLSGANIPEGASAYTALPSPAVVETGDYRIAPLDTLTITVFQEPDLSTPANSPLQVDSRGNINMPLVGQIAAGGKTTSQVSALIAQNLAHRYLKNPQVSVSVASSVPDHITVQGEVTKAGVFDVKGPTTLLQAIALAEGETKLAATNQVAVFRSVNGQRMGALFDVDQIRRGQAADPVLAPNDVVIVGHSRRREAWQNIMSVNPLYGVFRLFSGGL